MNNYITLKEIFVLSIIYELEEADIYDILQHVKDEKEWEYTSVETFLTRLYSKGYIERSKFGRRYRYRPTHSLHLVVKQVLDRLFRGIFKENPATLVSYLIPPCHSCPVISRIKSRCQKEKGSELCFVHRKIPAKSTFFRIK